jgi:hypothetical protein
MHVNLLPQPLRRRLAVRRQVWRWGIAIIFALAVGSGFVATQYYSVCSARHAKSVTTVRSKGLHTVRTETAQLLTEAKTIETSIASLRQSQPEDRTLALLGIAATSAKTLDGKIHLKSLATQMAPVTMTKQAAAPIPGAAGNKTVAASSKERTPSDFVLEGTADDATAIATFIEALRGTTVFAKVDLTATNEAASSSGAARHFRVDCKF